MTFLEAAFEVLKLEGKPLHYKELTERVIGRKLLTFVGRTPEVTMQTQLTGAVKKAPGNPFVRVKPGVFGLLRYPEVSAEERAAATAKATAKADEPPKRSRGGEDEGAPAGEGRGRRRRRGGRGRDRERDREETAKPAAAAPAGSAPDDGEDEEPNHGASLSPEARAAALAETGVLEGDDDAVGDEEVPRAMDPMDDDETAEAAPPEGASASDAGAADEAADDEDEGEGEGEGDEGAADAGTAGAAPGAEGRRPEGEFGSGRRRRRRRRRGGRGEGMEGGAGFGDAPRPSETALAAPGGEPTGFGSAEGASAGAPAGEGTGASSNGDNGQGPRRIMTPVDAALEILRGQAPGRGTAVRQIADMATRRRLVHGEPNEAWRVMRTALAAEPRERLRAGTRPRVRAAGAGLFALSRRPPEAELERAEQVFGDARRALRERTLASLERRLGELPGAAFEALCRVLLQREGFGPATFVKRVDGTVYVEALRGRGGRSSRCLVGLKFGPSPAGRRAIGELRFGIGARGQEEGLLMLAGRLADDAISEWKLAGPPIEIADGPALAETCIRHGVGVINAVVNVDFVDADFFAEIAEG
ncbi:MAG TPA: HTH domain-containing protein [Polyangia bacterium]|nr:HTH domain-containing protein [Polyangia bacterium]